LLFSVKKYEGISPVQVFMDSFGEMTTMRWVVDDKDFASIAKVGKQMTADQDYLEKANRSANLFKSHFVYPPATPMPSHLLRCQGIAVGNYSFTLGRH